MKKILIICLVVLLLPFVIFFARVGLILLSLAFPEYNSISKSDLEDCFHTSIPKSFSWGEYLYRHAAGDMDIQGYFYIDESDLFIMFPKNTYNWETLSNKVDCIIDVLNINIDKIDATVYSPSEQDSFLKTITSRDYHDLKMDSKCYKYLSKAYPCLSGEEYFIEDHFIGTKFRFNSKESIALIAKKVKPDGNRMIVYVIYNYYNFGGKVVFSQDSSMDSEQDNKEEVETDNSNAPNGS